MIRTLLLAVCLGATTSWAQDMEFPDYRSKKDIFTRVTEKDIRSDVASFSMGGIDEIIGKLPLKTLPVKGYANNYISFAGNDIEVIVKAEPFDPTKHKLFYYDKKYLLRIDGKPFFGDYGKVPKTSIGSVTMVIAGDTVAIPKEAYSDLFNPIFTYNEGGVNKSHNSVYLSANGKRIYIYMLKTETGGSYEVTWVIQDKKYVRRVVDFGFLK